MQVSRRRAVRPGVGAAAATLSGYSVFAGTPDHDLSLEFATDTDREKTVSVRPIDPDADDDGRRRVGPRGHRSGRPGRRIGGHGRRHRGRPETALRRPDAPQVRQPERDQYHVVPGEHSSDRSRARPSIGIHEAEASGSYDLTYR